MLLWSGLLALLGKPTALSNLLSSSSCVPRCLEWQLIGGRVGFAISTPTTTTASLGLACVSWEPVTVLAADKTSPRLLQWRVLVKDSLHLAVEQFDVAADWGSRTETTVGYHCGTPPGRRGVCRGSSSARWSASLAAHADDRVRVGLGLALG